MSDEQKPEGRNVGLSAGLERMTAEDRAAVAAMPSGWFEALNLPYPRVRRAEYRCNRLSEMGVLEMRVTGCYPLLKTEYRVRSNAGVKGAPQRSEGVGP